MEIITLAKEMTCSGCGKTIPTGAEAKYYSPTKIYHHPGCPKAEKSPTDNSYQQQLLIELSGIRHAIVEMTRAIREK